MFPVFPALAVVDQAPQNARTHQPRFLRMNLQPKTSPAGPEILSETAPLPPGVEIRRGESA